MKKLIILATVSMILLGGFSELWAGQVFGYTVAEKQVKFYIMILGVMGFSVAMVGVVYFVLWIAERKKAEAKEKAARAEARGIWRLSFEDFSLSI